MRTIPSPVAHRRRPVRWGRVGTHAVLVIVCALMAAPLLIVVFTAFKSNAEVFQNPIGLPRDWTFDNFVVSWQTGNFPNLFGNSILFTVTSMVIAIAAASLGAYALVRWTSRISAVGYLIITAGIFLPLQLAIIPQFRLIAGLGLIDTYLGVILVYVAGMMPFGVFLMAAFMAAIPRDFAEAAELDGAGYFRTYWSIYLPMSRPAIGSFIVLQGVGIWNDYLTPLLLLSDPTKRTLTTGIIAFKQQYVAQWGNLMAGVIIMTIPIIIVFLFAQRSFASGLMTGAVK